MANEYDSWAGAVEITETKLFDEKRNELDHDGKDKRYAGIRAYLPKKPANAATHYFVARVPTTSETVSGKDVLRLFVNESWDANFRRAIDALEFSKKGADVGELIADAPLDVHPAEWTIEGRIELFADLVPGKGRMAKVVFKNKGDEQLVSAFWCWP